MNPSQAVSSGDGDGSFGRKMRPLDETELVPFIAFLLLDAAHRGFLPNNTLTKGFAPNLAHTLRKLGNVQDVCLFLHDKCSVLLTTYLRQHVLRFPKLLHGKSKGARVGWSELLGLAECIYKRFWNASRPEHPEMMNLSLQSLGEN